MTVDESKFDSFALFAGSSGTTNVAATIDGRFARFTEQPATTICLSLSTRQTSAAAAFHIGGLPAPRLVERSRRNGVR